MYYCEPDCDIEQQEMYSLMGTMHRDCLEKLDKYDIDSEERINKFLEDYYDIDPEARAIMAECEFGAAERAAIKRDFKWFAREMYKRREDEQGESQYFDYLEGNHG